ncbi:MAG TPA: ATP-binding protein [Solirubrobacterales bacterium]|nr:ATP-binding protein [Solirubrobacterales bacterium]
MKAEARVEFSLPARAENVPLVRHALAGMAEELGMGPGEVADLKTVVTEACTNVVVHAYEPDEVGPLMVSAAPENDAIVVTVRDYGQGIRPLADVERRSLRLGLPLIAALSRGFEIQAQVGGGTLVRIRMPMASNGAHPSEERPVVTDEMRIDIDTGAALAPVLSRVISMFATRADFSVDRLSDAVLISDALSAGARASFADGSVRVIVTEDSGSFAVRIGPLDSAGGQRLIDGLRIPQLGATLEVLAEEVGVEEAEDGEYVVLRIARE